MSPTTFRVARMPWRPQAIWTRCPNMKCGADVVVAAGADRAKCKQCGLEWPWTKTALVRGTRGA